ncbi:alpha/beta fold hydrolase [Pseudoduganella armeniaca]|uniref:Alpha/beta hydrolase n=1 Tax=Pseudoduganella armeniaca TaxID=2072590 RepID=A0A2R4C6W5_9BURK|nr:alpha/beta fold hydrolase [Pseudoduganella armeniaca]AVR95367.1 alpha/beta hydrolase [Pseudoduganella armeniaca]
MQFSEDRLDSFAGRAGATRTIHIWEPAQPPRAVLLALHGGMAHAGDWVTPALYLREHGYATAAYDLCGHAQGPRADIPDFDIFLEESALFLDWIRSAWPGLPVFVIGHSMGGLIATKLGLRLPPGAVAGFVLSSPYYVNAIPVPAPLRAAGVMLERLAPTMKVPLASLTDVLTHDAAITARHHRDEASGVRASEISVRFGQALQRAQRGLTLAGWAHPLYVVLAGQDRLADTAESGRLLSEVPPHLLTCRVEPDNYHENFNEIDRDAIFADIVAWLDTRLAG